MLLPGAWARDQRACSSRVGTVTNNGMAESMSVTIGGETMRAIRSNTKKYLFLLMVGLAATMLGIAACGGDDEKSPAGQYGGTLTVTTFGTHTSLDPPFQVTQSDIIVTQHTYDNLVMIQPDLSLKPMLATSWEPNDDLTSYTFRLRKGVKFHHGKDFKAEDVVSTFQRLLDPELDSPARSSLSVIKDMVILDDHSLRFDLDAPNAFFVESLSLYQGRIVPSDIDPARLTLEEFGTGAFTISEHLPGERTVMVRNPDYWDKGLPYLDGITVVTIPEGATRAEALKTGDVDLVFGMEEQSVSDLEAHADTTVLETASPTYLGLYMDVTVAPFDNVLVRKAIQAATDREAIRQSALLGKGSLANDHPIAPNDPHFASQYAPPAYDTDRARSLLEQAGHPNGIDLTLVTSPAGAPMVEFAVAMKERAEPAGIRINIREVPEEDFWSKVWLQEPFATMWWNGRPPDAALSVVYLSDASWNESKYQNPTVDQLIVKARGQKDLEERRATYAEIQRILIDDVPRIIAVFKPNLIGVGTHVRGIEVHPLNWPIFHRGWLDN
jgi:peptide/nickel transport system substrate-binding protein